MKNLKYYFNKAQKEGWAIGQFNFSTLEQFHGIVLAVKNLRSPIILGTSEGESKFLGLKEAVALRNVLREETGLPIFLNLDHGKSFEYVKKAIDAGYDMVHFDGSKLPIEENIKITKQIKGYIKSASWRRKGVLLEGEIGVIGTDASKVYTEKFEIKEENLTKPEQAKNYIEKTKVDLLAISVGNFHGMSFGENIMDPHLRLDILEDVSSALGQAQGKNFEKFLVLHGGSGTPEEDIKSAIKLGIVKININTELRMVFANSIKKYFKADQEETTPYKFLAPATTAVQKVVEEKIKLFGSENKA